MIRHGLYSILRFTIVAISHLNEARSMTRDYVTCLQIVYFILIAVHGMNIRGFIHWH